MAQAVSIKQEELKNISRIMMQRKGDVIKVHHYPEFHLFFAFDPLNEKDLHVMDINTTAPMIDYYLGEGYRITEIKKNDDKKITEKEEVHLDELLKSPCVHQKIELKIIEHETNGDFKEALKMIKTVLDDRNTLEVRISFLYNGDVKRWTIKRGNNIFWKINDDPDNEYSSLIMTETLGCFVRKKGLIEFKVN